jgi:hypothetical protein
MEVIEPEGSLRGMTTASPARFALRGIRDLLIVVFISWDFEPDRV